ncbi:MAG: ABC transporter permease [Propionibacteriaceae bacterium]|nr:ABC transporter permease [Propionibacteriaceae bacterium]
MTSFTMPEIAFRRGRILVNDRDMTMVAILLLVLIALAIAADPLTNHVFYSAGNLTNMMRQWPSYGYGLIAVGMLFVILTGGIDLSVGSVLCFAGLVSAGCSLWWGLPIWLCMFLGIGTGVAWGAVNGFLVSRFQLAPFVVTLATMTTIRGLCYVWSPIALRPSDPGFTRVTSQLIGPFPPAFLVLVAFLIIATVFFNRTPLGRSTIAIGGNRETVRLAGISVKRGLMTAYMISGFCAGTAGVLIASRSGQIQPLQGAAFELDAIAACVIGGASLAGGKGTIRGTIIGMVILVLLNNILSLRNVQSFWQQVFKGLIIIVVILIQSRSQKKD